jgi:hypothetical protein
MSERIAVAPVVPDPDLAGEIRAMIAASGFAVVHGRRYVLDELCDAWSALDEDWNHLELDEYMPDGSRYRRRRFGRFGLLPATAELRRLPHATVLQSREINGFAGGINRDFAPLRETTFRNPALLALVRFDFGCFEISNPRALADWWEVWIHQIRIVANAAVAVSPAPEGTHHDGHDFIAMHLVRRENVTGGINHITDNNQLPLHSGMLENALDTIYADDHRVMHSVDPIEPVDATRPSYRDMLIIDFDHRPQMQPRR